MTAQKISQWERLVINGVDIYEPIIAVRFPDKNGVWEFSMEGDRKIIAAGNVMFIGKIVDEDTKQCKMTINKEKNN